MSHFPAQPDDIDVERIMGQVRDRIEEREEQRRIEEREEQRRIEEREEQRRIEEREEQRRIEEREEQRRIEERNRREERSGRESAPAAAPDRGRPATLPPSESFVFYGDSIYRSSRGGVGPVLHRIRRLLRPLVKFVFNIDPMVDALATQARLNAQQAAFDGELARRLAACEEQDALGRRGAEDLVAEVRRLSAEMKRQRSVVESVAGRLGALEQARDGGNAAPPPAGGPSEGPAGGASPSPAPPATGTPSANR